MLIAMLLSNFNVIPKNAFPHIESAQKCKLKTISAKLFIKCAYDVGIPITARLHVAGARAACVLINIVLLVM